MTLLVGILCLIGGTVLGLFLAAMFLRGRMDPASAVLQERLAARERQGADQAQELDRMRAENQALQNRIAELEAARSRVEATLETERRGTEEKLRMLTEARDALRGEFENLANRIFDDKSRRFTTESRESLGALLTPLREQLDTFRQRVDAVHEDGLKERATMLQEVRTLKELNQRLSAEAVNLTQALKGESKTQGNWGELVLERILELSGLTRGREYDTQVHLGEKFGGAQSRYPDVVVHLPEGKDIVIDSKVSLTAYESFCSAGTDEARTAALRDHIESVRRHLAGLSAKNYEGLQGIHSLDLVVLCIPNESAFIAAVSNEYGLYDEAFRKHIMLVGPSTLLLTLRIIATIWRYERQNRNALDIAERGQLLYEKLVGFVDDLAGIGQGLHAAEAAYDAAYSKLSTGAGNLVGQAQKLLELGVRARKQLPADLVEKSEARLPPAAPSSQGAG